MPNLSNNSTYKTVLLDLGNKNRKADSFRAGGRIKKRKGGLFRPTSKANSREFSENIFEAGMGLYAVHGAQPIGLAMMAGSAVGSEVVEFYIVYFKYLFIYINI